MIKCTEMCFTSVGEMKERYQTLNCITNLGNGMGRKKKGGGRREGKKERCRGACHDHVVVI